MARTSQARPRYACSSAKSTYYKFSNIAHVIILCNAVRGGILLSKASIPIGCEVFMGCARTATGSRGVPWGRHAAWCFLCGFLFRLPAGGAIPVPQSGSSGGPTPLSFGNQEVGSKSEPQTINLQNTGLTVLVFTSIQASANFTQTNTCQPSVTVGGNCNISVTFNPSTTGPLSGTLQVHSNAAGPPYVVNLSGTGVVPPPDVSPATLAFNNQDVGTKSATQQ